jgi:hypothetical protein
VCVRARARVGVRLCAGERVCFVLCQSNQTMCARGALVWRHERHVNRARRCPPCTTMQTLNLRHNRLATVPRSIFGLKSLKTLNLSANRLAGVPPEGFGQLQKLRVLDLSDNRIQALPVDCGTLGVEELNLDGNQLSELAPTLADAPRLRVCCHAFFGMAPRSVCCS